MSDSVHSTVLYTSISSDCDPSSWGIPLMDVGELPEMDPYEEVSQQGKATPPSPAYVPDPMELEHVYPEYLVPSDDDIPVEDPEEDLEEQPVEDPIDYAADVDDDNNEEEDSFEDDDDEEEEHLAPADSTAVASPTVDLVPSAEEIEPFETDESAATPPPPPAYQVARILSLPTPPPSSLTSLSSPLPQIPPLPTSPTYAQAPLDDIIFGSTKKSLCTEFEKMMHKKFQMSSMGELTFFLGLQVKQKEDGIFISQDKYVTEILKKFGFTDVKTASTPMETQKLLLKDEDGKEVDVHLYRSMIGSLMYLTSSRPNIMFAVCACARYQVNPKVSHLHAVKRIFRYLKGQPKLGLWYPKDSPFDLVAYTDSDYARASLDRKSTTGGCQFLRSRLISWQCKKQTVVANSTTEAEYVAASSCCGQFWATVKAKTVNGEVQLQALVDGKKIIITESIVRRDLQLEDAEGIDCLPNATIFEQLSLMSMVKNLENVSGKFLTYPRFVQVFLEKQLEGMSNHRRIYVTPSHTKKIFGNMRRVGKGFSRRETPLFQTMVVQHQEEMGEGSSNPTNPYHIPTIIQPSTSQSQKKQKPRKPKRKDTEVPQPSGPTNNVADEAVNEEMHDSLERTATTTTCLDAERIGVTSIRPDPRQYLMNQVP
ncbi:uncharacterized mitochondrial protein-like protein [Tanacetum coccineum]